MQPLIFLGAGDLSREIWTVALEPGPRSDRCLPHAFVDDNPALIGSTQLELPIWSFEQLKARLTPDSRFICAVGQPKSRVGMLEKLRKVCPQAKFAVIVHQSAVVMPQVELGPGCYIAPQVALAIAVRVGAHAVVNQNCSVGHDAQIGDHCVISPGCMISGRTQIGEESFLGSGAVTYPGVRIGRRCTLSAKAVLTRALQEGQKAIAKPNLRILGNKL